MTPTIIWVSNTSISNTSSRRKKVVCNISGARRAAWAGVASGNNESAGKKKDQDAVMVTHI